MWGAGDQRCQGLPQVEGPSILRSLGLSEAHFGFRHMWAKAGRRGRAGAGSRARGAVAQLRRSQECTRARHGRGSQPEWGRMAPRPHLRPAGGPTGVRSLWLVWETAFTTARPPPRASGSRSFVSTWTELRTQLTPFQGDNLILTPVLLTCPPLILRSRGKWQELEPGWTGSPLPVLRITASPRAVRARGRCTRRDAGPPQSRAHFHWAFQEGVGDSRALLSFLH